MKTQQVIEKLEILKKQYNRYANLSLIILWVTILSSFWLCPDAGKCLQAYGIGIIAAIVAGVHSSKYYKQYRELYKNVFVKGLIKEKLEDVHYDWKCGFTGTDMYHSKLLQGDGNMSDDFLKASYKGVAFEQADLKHFNGYGKNARIDFRGKVIKFRAFPISTSGVWIYSKKLKLSARYYDKSRKWIVLKDNEFSKAFDVYAYNQSDAERILTPKFKEMLLTLAGKYEALGMSFHGSILHIGIHTPRDTFDVDDTSKKVNYDDEVMKVEKDIEDITELIELLQQGVKKD